MPIEASLWSRLAARAIDLALALLVLYLVTRLVPAERVLARLLLGLGLLTTSEALFVQHLRATPGKLAAALRVAPIDREEIDPVAAWERAAVSTVGSLALILVPSAVMMMVDSLFGLLVGGTVVAVAGGYVLLVLTARCGEARPTASPTPSSCPTTPPPSSPGRRSSPTVPAGDPSR